MRGIAADGAGFLYLLQRGSVQKIDAETGQPIGSASFFPGRPGGGVAISGPDLPGAVGDSLWVSLRFDFDFLNGLRRIHTDSMQTTGEWIDFAEPPGELVGPNRLAAGPGGAGFLVLDAWPRLQRFDAQRRIQETEPLVGARDVVSLDGGRLVSYGDRVELRPDPPGLPLWNYPFGGGEPLWITAIAADAAGSRSYLADLVAGRILVLGQDGSEQDAWDLGGSGLQAVSDMDVLADGRLLLAQRARREIELRDPDSGAVLDRWSVRGRAPARSRGSGGGQPGRSLRP